jgi:hypothetical protein
MGSWLRTWAAGASPVLEVFVDEEDERAFRAERKRLSENNYNRAQSLAAWLMATLVATNGAGAATLLGGAAPLVESVGTRPVLCFIGGVIAALTAGFGSWLEAQDRSGLHYWESRPSAGLSNEAARQMCWLQFKSAWFRRAARVANATSLAAFIVGCSVAAVNYS